MRRKFKKKFTRKRKFKAKKPSLKKRIGIRM